jgi:hypothetical protein
MENFTATDERGWKTICRVIDDSDYYVLILGGLYGSIDQSKGISWTQREYEYATSKGIPVMAFLRESPAIPGDMVERDPDKMKLLQKFIERVRANHLCKTWKTAEDLSAAVASSLRNHIQDDEDEGHPRPGWIRGDTIPSMESLNEFARLSSENARLKSELAATRSDLRLPILELVKSGEDNSFQEISTQGTNFFTSNHQQGSVVVKYLLQRSRTLWLELAVKNSGQSAARNVSVSLQFPEAAAIHLELRNPGKNRPASITENTNPASHCYVDSRSDKVIRQRIKLIAPGISEPLVRFGVEFAEIPPSRESSLACLYSIAEESGASARGQFIARLKWTADQDMYSGVHLLPD